MTSAFKKAHGKVKGAIDSCFKKLDKYPVFHNTLFQVILLAFITTIIIEILSKRSLFKAIKWFFVEPYAFFVNIIIVAITYGAFVFLRRKYSWFFMVFMIWLAIGVIDCVVISSRITPFTFGDLKVLSTVIEIIPMYLKPWQMVLAGIAIVLALAVIVLGFLKFPVNRGIINRKEKLLLATTIVAVGIIIVSFSMKYKAIETNFKNIRNAYQDYGLAYCFMNSIVNTGISKPSGYSKDKVDEIINNLQPTGTVGGNNVNDKLTTPNVIVIQLESFFNVNRIQGATYTTNPIPFMSSLYEKCDTGLLEVPSISAGTANTEFEVLTGMNMADFGPGEYPYKTVLSEEDVMPESLAENLKFYGYYTHAIHNNTASFYNRNIVFPKLGFNRFTSIEYMTGIERNHLNWCKDKYLTPQIINALDATTNQDFVFAVSVQAHGNYPDEDVLKDNSLLVSLDGVAGEIGTYNFAYYLEQINEVDKFVEELVTELETRKEPTMLVLYGDHLPGFDLADSDLSVGSLYQTEYVIWRNFDKNKERKVEDLNSYQLAAYIMEQLGYDEGVVTKLHQNRSKYMESQYLEALKVLEYDMLYGDMNCWGGVCPYEMPVLRYGYDSIRVVRIESIVQEGKSTRYCFIEGDNFNEYSTVFLNKTNKIETIYIDEHTLFVPEIELSVGDFVYVSQSSSSIDNLTSSNPYEITEKNINWFYTGKKQ